MPGSKTKKASKGKPAARTKGKPAKAPSKPVSKNGRKPAAKPAQKPKRAANRTVEARKGKPGKGRKAATHANPEPEEVVTLTELIAALPPDPEPNPAYTTTPNKQGRMWYVITVDPKLERRVKKDIKRKKLINEVKGIGRCYSPLTLAEVPVYNPGEIVAEGKAVALTAGEAADKGRAAAYDLEGLVYEGQKREPDGYRVRVFPSKAKEKGKVSNTWDFVVRTEPSSEPHKTVMRQVRKFPGYVVCGLKLTNEVFHLIKETRGVFGFLDSNDNPTALRDKESAELLIEMRENGQKIKEHREKMKMRLNVGDRVEVLEGFCRGLEGKVLPYKDEGDDPTVKVEVGLMGRPVPVDIPHSQLRKVGS